MGTIRIESRTTVGDDTFVVPGGFALPTRFGHRVLLTDDSFGVMPVEVEIEQHGNRLRARRVCVESDRDIGIGSATLRAIPVREIMFVCVADVLQALEFKGGHPSLVSVRDKYRGKLPEEAALAVKQLVGYVDATAQVRKTTKRKPANRARGARS